MKKLFRAFLFLQVLSLVFVTAGFAGGSVAGKIKFEGTAPAPQKIDMGADPTCQSENSGDVFNEEVKVNADNTLANVFVYVKSGLEGKTFPAPATTVSLDQKGCHYTPHVFGVQTGQQVEIVNSDPTLHNVHGMPTQSKEFNLGMPLQGMKLKRKFDKAEIMVKFKCDVHPWMNAYIGVVDHPFFSVTGDAGSFEIKDLPAGSYVIEAWQEKLGTQTQNVTVEEGKPVTVDFTFKG